MKRLLKTFILLLLVIKSKFFRPGSFRIIGLSVLYFRKISPNSIIHAFEPDPKTQELLEVNGFRHQILLSRKEFAPFLTHKEHTFDVLFNLFFKK